MCIRDSLQTAAHDALSKRNGAVIVMEPSTGNIRAMVSKPDYDPSEVASKWELSLIHIYMGVTENLGGCQELVRLEDGRVDALANEDGSVMGSYLHGIFDTDGFAEEMIRRLMKEKGMEFENWHFDLEAHKEQE